MKCKHLQLGGEGLDVWFRTQRKAMHLTISEDSAHGELIMKNHLKWVHMARYDLILKQDGAIWLRIISELLPAPQKVYKMQK